jgi:hypothetical protein
MKTKFLTFTITGVIALMSLSVFAQENKKAAKARKEVSKAEKNLQEAKIDSAEDFYRFKKDAEFRISENEKRIAELKAKRSNDSEEARKKYDDKVLTLERKNNELRKRINDANTTKTDMWTSFKRGFNNDMKSLEDAIKNI